MSFGNGNGDYVELGGQVTLTSSGGVATIYNTDTGINSDTISMGAVTAILSLRQL
jgi:hypothetical protein